jgi:hypothetical protein
VKQSEKLIALCERFLYAKIISGTDSWFFISPNSLGVSFIPICTSMSKTSFRFSVLPKSQLFCGADTFPVPSVLRCLYV